MGMEITLTQDDLDKIKNALGETPLKYAMPIFQILSTKVQQKQQEQQQKDKPK